MRDTGFPKAVKQLLLNRADGRCERCGMFTDVVQYHHRRPRGMGSTKRPDTNTASAGLVVCRPCHDVIESQRADAMFAGFLVSQYASPADTPVWRLGQWVTLHDDGTWTVRG